MAKTAIFEEGRWNRRQKNKDGESKDFVLLHRSNLFVAGGKTTWLFCSVGVAAYKAEIASQFKERIVRNGVQRFRCTP